VTLLAAESEPLAASAASGALESGAWLLVALPLLGAAVLLLGGRRTDAWGHWLATALSWASFVVGAGLFTALLGHAPEERARSLHLFTWVPAGPLSVDAGLLLDQLSLTFVLLVTFVGSLIHVYSVAYMAPDSPGRLADDHRLREPGERRRFFAYLNLFVAAMLLLVLADSFLLLFVGWEGVGLASYLLIGFWNYRPAYAAAAKKAFVANRVGDFGLIVAMALMFATFGALDYASVLPAAGQASEGVLTAIGLLLLLAACGKSAQFPLQSWLGDAMAGPTPVSALIHAATMVTAGVYLVVRAGPLLEGAPAAQLAVVLVGAITLTFGAVVGCAKDDIKKALAASTMSQIGYMMLAAGLGPVGYVYAIFHLVTHGFFKAGLFLGAGSVMHAMGDEVDMRRFGDLGRHLRITWLTFAAGWLAIIGLPPLSGFWSKDLIIESAFIPQDGQVWRAWVFGTVTLLVAGLTAFYMSRLYFMTFHGKARWEGEHHPHEAPALMTVPMVVLAVGSVALGGLLAAGGTFRTWLEPAVGYEHDVEPVLPVPVIMALTLLLVLLGALLAWRQYATAEVPRTAPRASVATRLARRDLGQDDVNEALLMRPGQYLTRTLVFVDGRGVDGGVTGFAAGLVRFGSWLRHAQTGYVRSYAASMLGGTVAVLAMLWVVV
jgi:NADH-quinone oxidoreductase subunit L